MNRNVIAVSATPQTRLMEKIDAYYRVPFAITTLLDAFLVFQVQPIISHCVQP